jgi:hypothetical protein
LAETREKDEKSRITSRPHPHCPLLGGNENDVKVGTCVGYNHELGVQERVVYFKRLLMIKTEMNILLYMLCFCHSNLRNVISALIR